MRVVVHHNPNSGRGLARTLAERTVRALEERGHAVKSLAVGGAERVDLDRLRDAHAVVVIGGDGSVAYQANASIETGVPLYHAGTGNENLFAREFGMSREPVSIVKAVEKQDVTRVDVARVGGGSGLDGASGLGRANPMLLMAGTGCDAGVIKRVAEGRTRAIGHLAYVEPVIREGLFPSLRPVTVTVDGQAVVEHDVGQLIIANSPRYAVEMNPACDARIDDGLLDVVFLPAGTSVGSALWLGASRLRIADRFGSRRTARGTSVRVTWPEEPGPVQIDGEHAHTLNGDGFEITIDPGVLPVLLP